MTALLWTAIPKEAAGGEGDHDSDTLFAMLFYLSPSLRGVFSERIVVALLNLLDTSGPNGWKIVGLTYDILVRPLLQHS